MIMRRGRRNGEREGEGETFIYKLFHYKVSAHLDEIVDASEVALLVVAKVPGLAVGDADPLRHGHGLGKVNHPHTSLLIVVNDQYTASNYL